MRNSIKNINRLYNVAYNSIFTINGRLSYDRVTDCLISLAEMIQETETDEFTLQEIGEYTECSLSDLIVGAFWHYTEYHGGQSSKGYKALSELSGIYSPGMEAGPEPETGEHSAYEMLNRLADISGMRIFDSGGETMDRYTAFPFLNSPDKNEKCMFLGFAEGGRGVSMWGEIRPADLGNLSFLGQEITLSDLSPESQKHLMQRVYE